jgi:hypothetical protein
MLGWFRRRALPVNKIDVYIAVPYSHPDARVRDNRAREADRYAVYLLNRGMTFYSPISMTHGMCKSGLVSVATEHGESDWERYAAMDTAHLANCRELHVLCVQGWFESVGVRAEIRLARELDMQVVFIEPANHGLALVPVRLVHRAFADRLIQGAAA